MTITEPTSSINFRRYCNRQKMLPSENNGHYKDACSVRKSSFLKNKLI